MTSTAIRVVTGPANYYFYPGTVGKRGLDLW